MTPSVSSHLPAEADPPFLTTEPLNVAALLAGCSHPQAGAWVLFSGEVRNHNLGKAVLSLEYEAHLLLASRKMAEIINEARERWALHAAVCQHRLGKLWIGESAVVVITGASHRGAAYESNRFIMEKIKFEAPIWKKEHFADGTSEWGHNSGQPFQG